MNRVKFLDFVDGYGLVNEIEVKNIEHALSTEIWLYTTNELWMEHTYRRTITESIRNNL